ncbi:sigma-70 family RNA polymerase sigma factor [Clostridium intestinale]|uniref:sigma-70 family RNA polymerase sigma factor n=1 Tax=Clostridium intestinale TaxID=36845 RepID=UPI002DD69C65|nr:sigma-70 family RNA polymerase sigma factor [Clostridium intestinale]WRY53661.1 sigma-70 family RNA polymerase sigma factor [Clostridium intestinale]
MDRYIYIDDLVSRCKSGDKEAKNILAEEYYDMAKNLTNQYVRKNTIKEYEVDEIINQCLFKVIRSVDKYRLGEKTFTAYAEKVIRNCLEDIGRNVGTLAKTNGHQSLIMDDIFVRTLSNKIDSIEDKIYKKDIYKALEIVLKRLTEEESELIDFIFFKDKTVKAYSDYKNVPYMHAIRYRDKTLYKLKVLLQEEGYTEI